MELLGVGSYDQARQDHQGWAAECLGNGASRDDKWTKSIAVNLHLPIMAFLRLKTTI